MLLLLLLVIMAFSIVVGYNGVVHLRWIIFAICKLALLGCLCPFTRPCSALPLPGNYKALQLIGRLCGSGVD